MKGLLPVVFLVAACATGARDVPIAADKYRAIVADPVRTESDRNMDARRHPLELLQFAQVRPGMIEMDVRTAAVIASGSATAWTSSAGIGTFQQLEELLASGRHAEE